MPIADSKHMSVFFTRTGIEFMLVCPSCHIYPFIEIEFVGGGGRRSILSADELFSRSCLPACVPVRAVDLSEPLCTFLGLSGPPWAPVGISGHLWASLGPSWLIWAHLGFFRPLSVYLSSLGISGPVWASLGVTGPIWTCLGLFGLI